MKHNPYEAGFEKKTKKKTFFQKCRLFVIAGIAVFAVAILAGCGGKSGEKIKWSDMELGSMLPEPPSNRGTVYKNSDEELRLTLEKVTDKQYNDYYDACVEMGFDIDGDKDDYSYKAYNSEGYCLDMSHISDDLNIELTCPKVFSNIEWPNSTAGNMLPAPKSTVGEFSYEHDDSFYVEIGNTSKADYDEYVSACSERGFTVDYDKGDDYYYADNAEGWHLSLNYEGNNIMAIRIDKPDEEPEDAEPETAEPEPAEPETAEPEPAEPETAEPEPTTPPETNENGLRPDFKEAMDSYEAFIDEYIAFMEKYEDNPSDLSLLVDYANYMSKYAEFAEDFEKWEDDEMNAAETAYYIDVQARVSKKLLEVAQ